MDRQEWLEQLSLTTKRILLQRKLEETERMLTEEECRTELMDKLREEADSDLLDNQL